MKYEITTPYQTLNRLAIAKTRAELTDVDTRINRLRRVRAEVAGRLYGLTVRDMEGPTP